MLIVLFVISVIMLLVIPNISKNKASIDSTGNEAFATVVQTQLDLYKLSEAGTIADATAIDVLESSGYLSQSQADRAESNLQISGGKVTVKGGH